MITLQSLSLAWEHIFVIIVLLVFTLWIFRKLVKSDCPIKDLESKYVLITGCDSGFGQETAILLDSLGVHVIATCLTARGEQELQKECCGRVRTFRLDVTKSKEVQEVYRALQEELPHGTGLWGVVNNAGIAGVGPVDWIPVERFKHVADINLWGLVDVTKTFLPLVKRARGRIVNVTSIAGRFTLPFASPYSVSKYGAEAFSDAIRRELAPFGISVSIVEPGFFRTKMPTRENLTQQWETLWENLDDDKRDEYGEHYYNTRVKNMVEGIADMMASPNTHHVCKAIAHALTSRTPKPRYVIGQDANYLWYLLSLLPTSAGDTLLRMLEKKADPQCVAGDRLPLLQ
ncbi:predicted protein [Nematostella vectensis]|uniref:Uncharacterized protein n=1 Tax=Nematostella vectensis TaxID=45351 RepID=A7S3H1_NEMVE|nr:predicted protein [Nematostella vectensis]|eukprot:XP_001633833.1 predicted protein [Nematostella vectensis]